jgi:hypothetical protein
MTIDADDPLGDVDELIEQLQAGSTEVNDLVQAAEKINLDRKDLEQFILDNQGTLIQDSVNVLQIMKQYVAAAPNAEDVASFAELLKATSTAIDNLAKLHTSRERTDTQKIIKQMDIDAKKTINDDNNKMKLIGTRDEIYKKLLEDITVVDAEVVENDDTKDQS